MLCGYLWEAKEQFVVDQEQVIVLPGSIERGRLQRQFRTGGRDTLQIL